MVNVNTTNNLTSFATVTPGQDGDLINVETDNGQGAYIWNSAHSYWAPLNFRRVDASQQGVGGFQNITVVNNHDLIMARDDNGLNAPYFYEANNPGGWTPLTFRYVDAAQSGTQGFSNISVNTDAYDLIMAWDDNGVTAPYYYAQTNLSLGTTPWVPLSFRPVDASQNGTQGFQNISVNTDYDLIMATDDNGVSAPYYYDPNSPSFSRWVPMSFRYVDASQSGNGTQGFQNISVNTDYDLIMAEDDNGVTAPYYYDPNSPSFSRWIPMSFRYVDASQSGNGTQGFQNISVNTDYDMIMAEDDNGVTAPYYYDPNSPSFSRWVPMSFRYVDASQSGTQGFQNISVNTDYDMILVQDDAGTVAPYYYDPNSTSFSRWTPMAFRYVDVSTSFPTANTDFDLIMADDGIGNIEPHYFDGTQWRSMRDTRLLVNADPNVTEFDFSALDFNVNIVNGVAHVETIGGSGNTISVIGTNNNPTVDTLAFNINDFDVTYVGGLANISLQSIPSANITVSGVGGSSSNIDTIIFDNNAFGTQFSGNTVTITASPTAPANLTVSGNPTIDNIVFDNNDFLVTSNGPGKVTINSVGGAGSDFVDTPNFFFPLITDRVVTSRTGVSPVQGLESSISLSPFGTFFADNEGSSVIGLVSDDNLSLDPKSQLLFVKSDTGGVRWALEMVGQDQGGAMGREGAKIQLVSYDNQGNNPRVHFEFERDNMGGSGVVFPTVDLRANPPANPQVGQTVFNTDPLTKGLRTWDGSAWI